MNKRLRHTQPSCSIGKVTKATYFLPHNVLVKLKCLRGEWLAKTRKIQANLKI